MEQDEESGTYFALSLKEIFSFNSLSFVKRGAPSRITDYGYSLNT